MIGVRHKTQGRIGALLRPGGMAQPKARNRLHKVENLAQALAHRMLVVPPPLVAGRGPG